MYSSGLENMKSKTSSYSFAADCPYCFWSIEGTLLENNEVSTVSQLHALALEIYHAEMFFHTECMQVTAFISLNDKHV
jgi:hypothetical protein